MTNALFRKRRPNQKEAPPSENEAKGWLVEKITEWLNDFPWLRVEHDVMVRTTDDQDEAQVDVLLIPSGLECDRSKFVVIDPITGSKVDGPRQREYGCSRVVRTELLRRLMRGQALHGHASQ